MKPPFSLCVYCGSRSGRSDVYVEAARAVGRWIGQHSGELVYGGGSNGLMGIIAQETLTTGGTVIGIIPRALFEREWANPACTELHVVDTMHERKHQMAERADAFIALAGGIGTLEEIFEAWTWRQLGYHNKPVGMLNTAGFYDGMLRFLRTSVEQGFLGNEILDMLNVGDQPEPLLRNLIQAAGFGVARHLEQI